MTMPRSQMPMAPPMNQPKKANVRRISVFWSRSDLCVSSIWTPSAFLALRASDPDASPNNWMTPSSNPGTAATNTGMSLAMYGHSQPHQMAPRNIATRNRVKLAVIIAPARGLHPTAHRKNERGSSQYQEHYHRRTREP